MSLVAFGTIQMDSTAHKFVIKIGRRSTNHSFIWKLCVALLNYNFVDYNEMPANELFTSLKNSALWSVVQELYSPIITNNSKCIIVIEWSYKKKKELTFKIAI